MSEEDLVKQIIAIVLAAFLGGSGIAGILFYFARRSLEKKLEEAEKKSAARRAMKIKRFQNEDEWQHANGRVIFWLYNQAMGSDSRDHLKDAFDELQHVEAQKKELDRQALAELEQE